MNGGDDGNGNVIVL